jgi:hypothetical protein
MNREVHVRFREGVGVKFPRATRLIDFHFAVGYGLVQSNDRDVTELSLFGGSLSAINLLFLGRQKSLDLIFIFTPPYFQQKS